MSSHATPVASLPRRLPVPERRGGWWPEVKDSFETFVREHPRVPLPDRLSWETSDTRATGRAHWLVIGGIGGSRDSQPLPDLNVYSPPPQYDLGVGLTGTTVDRIKSGSSFDRLGVREGDVILGVGDAAVGSGSDVVRALERYRMNAPLQVTVRRGGRDVQLSGKFDPEETRLPPGPLFRHRAKSARVDLVRTGNTVDAATRGVSEFTLLVSPDQFDFAQPLIVRTNGRVAFEGPLERSVPTLLKWAARDNDRAMLFGAEVKITVK